ncbi:hypothetical protein [Roseinatronobacter sp. NSM]|uniref:hypothetical protein n=1 Tax=Roseinatronobacter sp. NSM TaxID=3457785 RepID=UPI004035EEEB
MSQITQGAPNGPIQACACPEHAPIPAWITLPVGVVLTLAVLMLASAHLDHCARNPLFCAAPIALPVEDAPAIPAIPARPVLGHAFSALPLSLGAGGDAPRYTLPPGANMLDVATHPGAIALDKINLIAIVQQGDTRQALVRLENGTILRLRQGDRLEGGTVAAIADNAIYLLQPDMTPRALVLGG